MFGRDISFNISHIKTTGFFYVMLTHSKLILIDAEGTCAFIKKIYLDITQKVFISIDDFKIIQKLSADYTLKITIKNKKLKVMTNNQKIIIYLKLINPGELNFKSSSLNPKMKISGDIINKIVFLARKNEISIFFLSDMIKGLDLEDNEELFSIRTKTSSNFKPFFVHIHPGALSVFRFDDNRQYELSLLLINGATFLSFTDFENQERFLTICL